MNIAAPALTVFPVNNANVNTESARRDNVQRETVPQPSSAERSAAESGLGSESDRVKTPGQPPQPVTYDKPAQGDQNAAQTALNKDNGEDPSAGKQDQQSQREQQQEAAEQKEVDELKRRDQEVKAHEAAHANVGGQYAGAPQYEYETGPDGRQYAVGGEVSIDISAEKTPEETLRKMQQVKAAALAPAEPSPQDLRVASEAQQRANEARQEISQQSTESIQVSGDQEQSVSSQQVSESEGIIRGTDVSPPTRSLKESDPVAEAAGLESPSSEYNRDAEVNARALRIASFYQQATSPKTDGFQQLV